MTNCAVGGSAVTESSKCGEVQGMLGQGRAGLTLTVQFLERWLSAAEVLREAVWGELLVEVLHRTGVALDLWAESRGLT